MKLHHSTDLILLLIETPTTLQFKSQLGRRPEKQLRQRKCAEAERCKKTLERESIGVFFGGYLRARGWSLEGIRGPRRRREGGERGSFGTQSRKRR